MRRQFLIIGVLLFAGGVAGFFQNPVLGLFEVNTLLTIVHLVSGVLAMLAAPYGIGTMRVCGKGLGFLYLGLALAGFFLPAGDVFGAMRLNGADNVLHLALAWIFLYFGLLAPPRL